MPSHWTYDHFEATADLAQGDIVEPSPEIREILSYIHPHFLDPKYVSFMVLSQSCDLVRRSGYRGQPINLCVVRELSSIAGTLLEIFCGSVIPGVFRSDARVAGRQFLERAVNQNEQSIGLFYLHPDADSGVSTHSVAMLRIAIALRTEHYEKLREARRGRLRPEFQAKLGWLIGNLYSRVGTEDWSDSPQRKKTQSQIVDLAFNSLTGIEWASSEAVTRAVAANFSIDDMSSDAIRAAIASFEPLSLDAQVQKELQRILSEEDLGIPLEAQERFLKRLPNDTSMAQLFRRMRKL